MAIGWPPQVTVPCRRAPHRLLEGLTLRAGVENLTDEDPPIFPSWVAANTEPSQYDVLGRRYYVNLTYRF